MDFNLANSNAASNCNTINYFYYFSKKKKIIIITMLALDQCFSTAVPCQVFCRKLSSFIYSRTCLIHHRFNSSVRSSHHFFLGPGRIPIFCVHFSSSDSPRSKLSIRLIRHFFLFLRNILCDYYVICSFAFNA